MKNWRKVKSNSAILRIFKGYSVDFAETPYQPKITIRAKLNEGQEQLVSQEMKKMLEMGVIGEATHSKGQFVNHLFLVSKKGGGQ